MQNRYFGDVGDFGKYGLLRKINNKGLKLGVNWYLVKDEGHNDDGKHITYLQKSDYALCDLKLFEKLNFGIYELV